MIDIRDYDDVCDRINRIISKGGIVEIKLEKRRSEIAVVEIRRQLIKE